MEVTSNGGSFSDTRSLIIAGATAVECGLVLLASMHAAWMKL